MRSMFANAALPLISMSLMAACTSDSVVDELAGETAEDDAAEGKGDNATAAGGAYTYFAVKGDTRRCAFPLCGGYHLERVNRTTTVCHDGSASASCYTPELDWSEAGLTADARDKLALAAARGAIGEGVDALVRGRFAPTSKGKIQPELGRFIVTEAWVAQSESVSDGVFVKLHDNGVRCIAAPCPSTGEKALNTSRSASIADVDFSDSGLTDEQIGELSHEMFEPSGLIIAGSRYTFKIDGRSGKGRTATAVFARLKNALQGACYVGGCSGQICSDQQGVISTCEWREEYACYQQFGTCERQANNACGWTPTAELTMCLGN
jgi:hypothetical protein